MMDKPNTRSSTGNNASSHFPSSFPYYENWKMTPNSSKASTTSSSNQETNYAVSKPSRASNYANATLISSACTCRKEIWRDCSTCATTTSNRTRRRRQFGGIDRVEAHVERPKAQRCVEDLSSAHTLRAVSVGRLRGCHWTAAIY